ncbi:MAG: 50S ribosomal protein L11 methyltransferase, partial [Elusimicrobiaceae bacterium]|nr:50S ribosomal protein L11 methyltransferase [Elusimicrobiaceae bacterium]
MSTFDIEFAAVTDIGKIREKNEDNVLISSDLGLGVVADGMGGHSAGEIASSIAVSVLAETIRKINTETLKIPVQIYAATAFGSEHPTTKMCLTSISELKDLITPKKILDMGTGSGILSISASKLWKTKPQILSADIDQESVDVTHSNTITNNEDS